MRLVQSSLVALALGLSPVAVMAQAPAPVTVTAADQQAAGQFIDQLADQAFGVIRDKSLSKAQVRAKFRTMLRSSFDIQTIGPKLVRSHRAALTPAQAQAYLAVFPDYVVGTYADRLYEYGSSDLKIVRAQPRGTRGDIDVYSRITLPNGGTPIDAVWSVRKMPTGRFLIENLTVAGVNLALTQEADFSAYISRNGFDALLRFMRDAAAK